MTILQLPLSRHPKITDTQRHKAGTPSLSQGYKCVFDSPVPLTTQLLVRAAACTKVATATYRREGK